MKQQLAQSLSILCLLLSLTSMIGCQPTREEILFDTDEDEPWVFWYWMYASVSEEGITADLEAMKEAGIGGAYLMPILGELDPPLYEPTAVQLTPEWWNMVKHAIAEADRLDLKLGFHASDGFAVAGGPWIKPEQSMQKVVWSETNVAGGQNFDSLLPQPETIEGYYRDIAVVAFPTPEGTPVSSFDLNPKVTFSLADSTLTFLSKNQKENKFKADEPCWLQFEFQEPFTCLTIRPSGPTSNLQWQRLRLEVSNDGKNFEQIVDMKPPRQGWQNGDAGSTYSIPPTTARYFRFYYDKEGSEPGSEDLDAGKWKPKLVLYNIELLNSPRIHHFEGKSGQVWRVSKRTDSDQIPESLCLQQDQIIDLSEKMDSTGNLNWQVPAGDWTILRMGHTSTGHTNYTGGGGLGLECDKFSKEAVTYQFENWFDAIQEQAGPELSEKVISMLHVDSWECGSQNWSHNFEREFQYRRGYSLKPYLPVLAGIPLESADVSERFLYDFRKTISELYIDYFYETLLELAHENGVQFSAENVSPTMMSDGIRHFASVDKPMGEFWLRSPTHDKPNDMLDAISGAHIYGKHIVQAEAFTQLRMDWDEHPAALKALGDAQYAAGINKFFYHVFAHNPWLDKKPGMTLNGVGLYFQRDQTWWKPAREMVAYATRCQAILQNGDPVVDIAVFTGEEFPRRSILSDRLVDIMPGLFDQDILQREITRRINAGTPTRQEPAGVTHSANLAVNFDWHDPLNGYKYDSFNPHALESATVQNGRVILGEGTGYALLVIPGKTLMNPEGQILSVSAAQKLLDLTRHGATIMFEEDIESTPGLVDRDQELKALISQLLGGEFKNTPEGLRMKQLGEGRIIKGDYKAPTLNPIDVPQDVIVKDWNQQDIDDFAWAHRSGQGFDIYFLSNQNSKTRELSVSLRGTGSQPEIYDAVTDELSTAGIWKMQDGRTDIPLLFEPNGSLFIILRKPTKSESMENGVNWREYQSFLAVSGPWDVQFDPAYGGPKKTKKFETLSDWSESTIFNIKHYSGTATYSKTFRLGKKDGQRYWLDLGDVSDIAKVYVNGRNCGVAWTDPFRVEVTEALISGENDIRIAVTNSWKNRLIGDHQLPDSLRISNAPRVPYLLEGRPLAPSGLMGPVQIVTSASSGN